MASEFENLFDRLPTELIIFIIEKISDVKNLCVCYSVSKLFAALVPQTRFVSVQIPSAIDRSSAEEEQVWPPGIINFLKKLCCVEYVTIQFSLCDPRIPQRYSGHMARWKSDSSRFILVVAENRADDSIVESKSKLMADECFFAIFYSIRIHLYHFTMRGLHIKELLPVLPNLKKVSAVESAEHGSFVWEEDIDSMRRDVRSSGDKDVFCLKLWRAPSMKLPITGRAMKDVTLISIREIEGLHGFMDENSFEETEYRELAMIMMKEYPRYQTVFPLPLEAPIGWMKTMASCILNEIEFILCLLDTSFF